MLRLLLAIMAAVFSFAAPQASAQPADTRVALVVGNGGYAKARIPTALNDAALVAEALRTVGFEIYEGADVNQAEFTQLFREFLNRVAAVGPGAVAFVYVAGHAFAFDGDNYLVTADAKLERETDIPLDTVRLSELTRPLAAMPARARIVVVDAARPFPFAIEKVRLPHGLGPVNPAPGMLIAMAAPPGTVAQDGSGSYGAYATAIAEMLRVPGLDLSEAFVRIRERTHQLTAGMQTPSNVSALTQIVLVPPETGPARGLPPLRALRPMKDIGPDEAYSLAIEMDSLPRYVEFVETYSRHPYAPRVWAIIRVRREALAWMRALEINTPQSYWTYLRRYRDGIYAADAERRLRRLSAALVPSSDFAPVEFTGVPPPLRDEPANYATVYPPAPAPPGRLLPPQPRLFVNLAAPATRQGARFLPNAPALATLPQIAPGVRRSLQAAGAAVPQSARAPAAPPAAGGVQPSTTGVGLAPVPGSPAAPRRPPSSQPGAPQAPRALAPPAVARPVPPQPPVANRPQPPQPPSAANRAPAPRQQLPPPGYCITVNGRQICR